MLPTVPVVLIKLGGSLITDKAARERAHPELIERLAGEVARAAGRGSERLILGHGGGSFGHVAAAEHGLNRGPLGPEQLLGVALTQQGMARLHGAVASALVRAGARPCSFAPSSFMTASAGRPAGSFAEPLLLALSAGLLPVVFGDVVLDRAWGASICSTEQVFLTLARRLRRAGVVVTRALWLGETEGVYDRTGATIPRIEAARARALLASIGGARGTDVTGGMAHRLTAAAALARLGVVSSILDGRVPGRLELALAGEPVPGTTVVP